MDNKFFVVKEVREIIAKYLEENELEENTKRGHVRLDPLIGRLVGGQNADQKETRKDYIFKNLNGNLQDCHLITLIDESQLVSAKERQRFVKGPVPHVQIISQKVNNKKQTTITGLEVYQLDFDELTSYMQHKCASSVAMNEIEHVSTLKNPAYILKVQGSQIKALEDMFTEKYKILKKYITSTDKCSTHKKKGAARK